MARNIKGIQIDIGGNTAPLDKALQGVNKTSKSLQTELKQVEQLLKLDPTNTELLAQKQKLLAQSVDNTSDKLKTLKESEKQVQEQFKQGKITEEQYRAYQREIAKTEISMDKLEEQTKKTYKTMSKEDAINNLKKIGVAAGAAAVALGGALVGAAVKAGQSADDINTLAKQTGLTTEQIQKFQYATDLIDVPLETLTGSMAKLTKNMSSAKDGSKTMSEAFKTLGVDILDNNGKLRDNNDVFDEIITALGNVTNETERDAIAMKIFGKSAQDLNPLILGGADSLKQLGEEAEKAGLILSQDALDSANAFNDSIDALKSTTNGLFASIGTEVATYLLPYLQEITNKLKSPEVLESIKKIASNILNFIKYIIDNGDKIIGILAGIGAGFIAWNVASTIFGVVEAIKAFRLANEGATIAQALLNGVMAANPLMLIVTLIAGLVAAIVVLWNTNEDFRNALKDIWENITNFVSVAIEKVVGFFTKVVDFIKNNWQGLLLMLVNPFAGGFKLLYDNCDGFREFIDKWIIKIVGFFSELPSKTYNAIIGIKDKFANLKESLTNWAKTELPKFTLLFVGFLASLPEKMKDIGKNIVYGIWNGITGVVGWLKDKVVGFANGIVSNIKNALDIHSPSRKLRDEVGKNMALGIGIGFENEMDSVNKSMVKAIPTLASDFGINGKKGNTNNVNSNVNNNGGLNVTIDKFINNRSQDVEAFAEELGFYNKQKKFALGGAY